MPHHAMPEGGGPRRELASSVSCLSALRRVLRRTPTCATREMPVGAMADFS